MFSKAILNLFVFLNSLPTVIIASKPKKLANSNPDAMKHLKRVSWEGTENWDELLIERAKISGELVLSEFTINAINQFKAK